MSDKFNTRKVISNIFSMVPLPILRAVIQPQLIIPYYHMVSNSDIFHIKHLYPHKTVKQFIADIDYLCKHFNPIHLNDLLLFAGQRKPLPRHALLLTFDDGFREMHDIVAPILLQKGVPAIFFINSSFTDNHNLCYQHKASIIAEHLLKKTVSEVVQKQIATFLLQNNIKTSDIKSGVLDIKYKERYFVDTIAQYLNIDFSNYLAQHKPYLTTDQINKLVSDGFAIGAHSIDHPLYKDLSLEEQLRQTIESVNFVRKSFNLGYGAFAFPHSDNAVSKKYFNQIGASGLVDISFGTSGMIEDCTQSNFQRFSLERPLMPAEYIFALQFAKRLWRKIKHSNKIMRP